MATITGTESANSLTGTIDDDAINGLGGNDTISGGDGGDTVRGGAGNDQISAYQVGSYAAYNDGFADQVFGEDGNDLIGVGTGDSADGGTGNDTISAGGAGTFTGGTGTDTLRVEGSSDITGSLITGIERFEANGGSYGVYLTADQFNSFATIDGVGTNANVSFTLTGAGSGTLNLDPTVGSVLIHGSNAREGVTLAAGTTAVLTYDGGSGGGAITAGAGVDILSGNSGADTLRGGAGNDQISAYRVGSYNAYNDGFADQVFGEDGHDLIGVSAGDSADGGTGNDTISAGGAGTFIGGTGTDTLYVEGSSDITGSLVTGIERLEANGGSYGVYLTADQFNSFATIDGIGTDTNVSFTLTGSGSGTLNLDSTVGSVLIHGSNTREGVTLAAGTTAVLTYDGGSGGGAITAGAAADILSGNSGADMLRGGAGNDQISAYRVGSYNTYNDGFADQVFGEDGHDLIGISTGDTAYGGNGNDTISAGAGGTLFGDAGDDLLTGGSGINRFNGGAGADVFVFTSDSHSSVENPDIIAAFDGAGAAAGDKIDLSGIDANNALSGDQGFTLGSTATGGLSLVTSGSDTLLRGNTDADATFEFTIKITDGSVLSSAYATADFIL